MVYVTLPYPLKARQVNNYAVREQHPTHQKASGYGRVRTGDRRHAVGASKVMVLPGTALYNPCLVVEAICRCPKFSNAHRQRDASILPRVIPFQPAVVEGESEHSWAKHRITVVLCYIDNISYIYSRISFCPISQMFTLTNCDFVIKM